MDIANLVIGCVKDFGPTVWKYVKYQICPKDYVREFEAMQKRLEVRLKDVEAKLGEQCNEPGKRASNEVDAWLKEAREETTAKVEDMTCKGGCFTFICSSRKLDEKTRALNEGIFRDGERYTNAGESLVIEDDSIEYRASVFKDKQKQMQHQKEYIEANLKTQLMRPGKIDRKDVKDWLEEASQKISIKVEDLSSQGECSSSKIIKEKTEELKRILEKGKEFSNAGVSLVIDDHSKKGVPMPAEKCIARDDVRDKILQLLRGDKVTRIAVCGMGGVGKTTIMQQVHNQLLKEPKFDKVIWVKVSRDFDIVVQQKKQFDIPNFQKSIARKLGLDLKNGNQDAIELAGLISDKLQRGCYALILDDVWEHFCPNAVGIPDLVGNKGCKLVLTTRLQQEVGRAMKCEVIHVEPLPNDKASVLFLDEVGGEVVSHRNYKSDIEPILNQILKKCNGLPLAIRVVAKTMRGKFDCYSWEMADRELSKSEKIVDRLKFSYDHLDEQCKKCFLYCALYPEDHEIPEEELIELWIEEGFIADADEMGSRRKMICEGYVIFEKLIDSCLLELIKNIASDREGISNATIMVNVQYEEDRVSMHDLLREMALKIIGPEFMVKAPQFMVKAGMALEELPEEHKWREDLLKVSLMNNNIRDIPSSMSSPKCPMLTTLLLSSNNIAAIPEAFFDQMLGLKILDLSKNYKLCRLPSSVSKLENLTTLVLENCWSLKEVPSLSNLGSLKKLNLYGTSIEELPHGLNMLTNLKYLWLGDKLSEIPNRLLQNLSKLQFLGVGFSIPLKWEQIESLRKLESLDGCLSTLEDMSLFVKSRRILSNRYRIVVGSYKLANFHHNKTSSSARKLIVCRHIDICKEASWLPSDAEGFYILDCKDVRSLNDISGFQEVTKLQHCTIQECDGLEFVDSSRCLKPLQSLESLYLYSLKNLNAVFREVGAVAKSAPLPADTFSSLQKISIDFCKKIKKLLPLWLLPYLQNLQTINVSWCDQMEEIIWFEYEGGEKTLETLTLPKLQKLKLMNLPTLKSIYSGSTTVLICNSIKEIEISDCREIESVFLKGFNPLPTLEDLRLWQLENLKSVFDEEALGLSTPPATFFSLKNFFVHYCHKLKKVFSSERLFDCFQYLEIIAVGNCHQLEELISSSTHEEIEAPKKITLRNLQRLGLTSCPELKSIYSCSSVLICDSIKSLKIGNCKKLKRIPLHLSSLDNGQPLSLEEIQVYPEKCWESLEWDQPNAKDVLLPYVNFSSAWP